MFEMTRVNCIFKFLNKPVKAIQNPFIQSNLYGIVIKNLTSAFSYLEAFSCLDLWVLKLKKDK